jgi:hypothetical protein
MKHKIRLFSSHRRDDMEIPQWWKNFLRANNVLGVDEINRALEPYHARFRTTIKRSPWGIRSVTFDSEEAAIFFILRWS